MITAIVQARNGSTRLPGKVMKAILGKPMLMHQIKRMRQSRLIDQIVIATSVNKIDDEIERLCSSMEVKCFRGSEDDVLDRYYFAAKEFGGDTIVRMTADCPLIDPQVVDRVIQHFKDSKADYVSNRCHTYTYPDGLDAEVFSFDMLEKAWNETQSSSDREHVTTYIWHTKGRFNCMNVAYHTDLSKMRWTVDYPKDFEFVRAIYEHFGEKMFFMDDILLLLKEKPALLEINQELDSKIWLEKI